MTIKEEVIEKLEIMNDIEYNDEIKKDDLFPAIDLTLKKARDEIRKLIVKHYGKDEVVNAMYELEEDLGFKD